MLCLLRQSSFSIVFLFLISVYSQSALAVTLGPVWPAPGGTTFASDGNNVGEAGGSTGTYSGFDFSAFDQLWWGPADIGSAMDGAIDSASEQMTFSSGLGTTAAVWTGTTTVQTTTGELVVDTRFTATILGGSSGWIDPTSVGITPGAMAVAEISTDPFIVNRFFEAKIGNGPWTAFLLLYDGLQTIQGSAARTSFSGEMYYTEVSPVPLPAALPLFAAALAGFGLLGRRRRYLANS